MVTTEMTDGRNTPNRDDNSHFSRNVDVSESVCRFEEDPLAESEVESEEIEDRKPFIECINCNAEEDVSSDVTQNAGGDTRDGVGSHDTDSSSEKIRFRCPECEKDFISLIGYRVHMQTHKHVQIVQCDNCGEVFTNLDNLSQHASTKCTKKLRCDSCGKFYMNKYTLKNHMAQHGEKRFGCDECDKCYYTVTDLKRHKSTHSKVKIHTCEYCRKQFHSKDVLRLHKYTHEGRPPWKCKLRTCDECGFSAISKSKLTDHMRKHTGEKPFPCTECGMRFPVKRNLVRHMRVHDCGS